MLKDKRILFYVPGLDCLHNGVYYSQVYGLARYLVGQGACCLVVHTDYKDSAYSEKTIDGVMMISCPQDPNYQPLPMLPRKLRRSVIPAEQSMRSFAPTHFYVRDAFAGVGALSLVRELQAKLVYSCRGAGMAEGYKTFKEYIKEGILRYNMCRLIRRSTHVNSVCVRLENHLKSFYWYSGPKSILPCCVMPEKFVEISDEERVACRKELNIPQDAKVVVYSGGMGWYQCTDELLSLMKKVHQIAPEIIFMILTQNVAALEDGMLRMGLPKECVRIRQCLPQEVARYQQSADVGIIIRKNDPLNQMASPVKIGEYLSAGLSIIASPWIGDVGEMLSRESFAFMYRDETAPDEIVRFVRGISRESATEARAFARRYYTYEGNDEAVEAMFG